ncbi:PLD nuclease N-terminal domain-containing protein [Pseudomonas sp. Sample_10]|uniref:PLD nuclease N-terminal domain-containing protein n=1 Tax=Pseudomonas sp. Sample_10 TaxID=2448269 RepID=UPI0010357DEA|nr:PLD nuclease N-terminal domain-containing protein [Pseudomonas sp. Sample_10]
MSDAASQFSIIVIAIIAIVDSWAITSVLRSDSALGEKTAWLIGIVLFPVVGWIVWSNAGPRYTKKNLASPKHNKV